MSPPDLARRTRTYKEPTRLTESKRIGGDRPRLDGLRHGRLAPRAGHRTYGFDVAPAQAERLPRRGRRPGALAEVAGRLDAVVVVRC